MTRDSWTCLLVEKGPGMLDDEVRSALKMAACELNLRRSDRMIISNDVCCGIIQTKWDTHSVGTRSGVLFRAQVDGDGGDYYVNFLLSTDDLERGSDVLREMEENGDAWVMSGGPIPVPALYEFYDLQRPTNKRLLN